MVIFDINNLVVHLQVLGRICGESLYILANWNDRGLFRPRIYLPCPNQPLLLFHVRMLEEFQLTG
jgi:hypothetical protein